MRPEREHFSGNIKLNIITKSRLAILVTHHSAINNLLKERRQAIFALRIFGLYKRGKLCVR